MSRHGKHIPSRVLFSYLLYSQWGFLAWLFVSQQERTCEEVKETSTQMWCPGMNENERVTQN